jgi:hypothetical protein
MTFRIITLSVMTTTIMILRIMTLSIMILSVMAHRIMTSYSKAISITVKCWHSVQYK